MTKRDETYRTKTGWNYGVIQYQTREREREAGGTKWDDTSEDKLDEINCGGFDLAGTKKGWFWREQIVLFLSFLKGANKKKKKKKQRGRERERTWNNYFKKKVC